MWEKNWTDQDEYAGVCCKHVFNWNHDDGRILMESWTSAALLCLDWMKALVVSLSEKLALENTPNQIMVKVKAYRFSSLLLTFA